MADSIDWASTINNNRLNYAKSLLGSAGNNSIAGISTDLIQARKMLLTNGSAYQKLLQAQESGTIKKDPYKTELLSDKLYNDYYDKKTGSLSKPTYTPITQTDTIELDKDMQTGSRIDQMRTLALAAVNNPNSLTSAHYNLFNSLWDEVSANLVSNKADAPAQVTVEDATPATITKNVGASRLLVDDQNFTVSGKTGEKTYNFAVGDSLADVAAAINADTGETGVTAEVSQDSNGNYTLALKSTDTGKDSTVRVTQNVGDLFTTKSGENSIAANGTDALKEDAEVVASGDTSYAAIAAGTYTGKLFGSDQSFTIGGARGSKSYSFEAGTDVADVVAAINANTGATGVRAEAIRNGAGEIEGIGLVSDKAGNGQFVEVNQTAGDLFTNTPGGRVKVSGQGSTQTGSGINSVYELGRVQLNGQTYSFADLMQGGSASLANNPDAAVLVLDQTLNDIYTGRAEIKGFDPAKDPLLGVGTNTNTQSTNTYSVGNWGSSAISNWIGGYSVSN